MKIIKKPWGREEIWGNIQDICIAKTIHINMGQKLSRQYHEIKEETIMVATGTLCLEVGQGEDIKKHDMKNGENFHVVPGCVHRFCAPYGDVEIIEVSTPHLDDVVRLEDDYKRVK